MKKLKKLLSIVLAVAMVMSLAVSVGAVSAYSITITGTEEGITYKAYKLFDETYNETTNSYAYTITVTDNTTDEYKIKKWLEDNYGDYFTFELQNGSTTVYNVTASTNFNDNIAATLAANLKVAFTTGDLSTVTATKEAKVQTGDTSVTLELDNAGYYFVDTSLGSLAILNSVPGEQDGSGVSAITIAEKNGKPSVEKTVYDDSAMTATTDDTDSDAEIGDTVYFKTVISSVYNVTNLVLHDYMEEGLTLNEDSITVYLLPTSSITIADAYKLEKDTHYEIKASTGTETGPDGWSGEQCTFEIDFSALYNTTNAPTDEYNVIVVVYSATVNENATQYVSGVTDNSNDNETYVSYGTASTSEMDLTKTYTYPVAIYKYSYESGQTNVALSGVKFKIYYLDAITGNKTYVYVSGQDGVYKVDSSAGASTTEMTTTDDGQILIQGLDAEVEYYLEETETVAGYNLPTSDIKFKITGSDNTSYSQGTILIDSSGTWVTDGTGYQSISGTTYNSIEVQNNKGTELAATGGIGVTIFYVVGGILVLAAAGVIVISKKRRTEK